MAGGEPDPYLVLGVARGATEEEIRAAYRALVKRLHPDTQPDDPEAARRFRELRDAYERIRTEPARPAPPRRPTRPPSRPPSSAEAFAKVFEEKRASARFGRSPYGTKGDQGEVEIPFAASILGGDHRLLVRFRHEPGARSLLISLPPGTQDEERIRVEGKVLRVIVTPDAFLRRMGADVELRLPLSIPEACLGTELIVPTVRGPRSLIVPPGVVAGKVLSLPGLGVPPDGDQRCVVDLVLPDLSRPEERAMIEALKARGSSGLRPWED